MAANGKTSAYLIYACVVVLFSGAYSGISTKIMYSVEAEGDCGPNKFQKPYFFTLFMFVGEAMCLVYYYAEVYYKKYFSAGAAAPPSSPHNYPKAEPMLDPSLAHDAAQASASHQVFSSYDQNPQEEEKKKAPIYYWAILSCFDLSATTIGGIGLIWVSASANQMLRGSMILFTAVWTLIIFRKNLALKQWGGIGITMIGLVLVGGAGMLRGQGGAQGATASQTLIGILLVLAGSALNSCQGVLEERLMKGLGNISADPMEVVGWEGVFGCISSSFIMLPIVQAMSGGDCGSVENTKDTLALLHHSPPLTACIVFYAVALALMNNYSQVVSRDLSAVHRMLLNTCRVVLVWGIDLLIYYAIPGGKDYGESWDVYSWMQLGGFITLMIGTFVYVKAGLEVKQKEAEAQQALLPTPMNEQNA